MTGEIVMPKLTVLVVNQRPFSPDVHIAATLRNLNIQSDSVELVVNPEYKDMITLQTTVAMAAGKHGLKADFTKCICTSYDSSDGVRGIAVQVNGGNIPSASASLFGRPDETTNTESEEKNKGNCFIATAAFGTPDAPAVTILREYREHILRPMSLGQLFIRQYERFSPPVAALIAKNRMLRFIVRKLLVSPLSWCAKGVLKKDPGTV